MKHIFCIKMSGHFNNFPLNLKNYKLGNRLNNIYYKIVKMVYGSIVSILDRLSIKTVLTNYTGSIIGFIATLGFIAACLAILIPPVNQYFTGSYYQSQFSSDQQPKNEYILDDQIILAISFRNKVTGQYANHAQILDKLNGFGLYFGVGTLYKTDLKPCRKELFMDSINPIDVKDCVMLPPNLLYDSKPVDGTVPSLQFLFQMRCDDVFQCNANNPVQHQIVAQYITNLSKNFYYEFIFNSKVVDQKGRYRNQFHKVYSSQYQSPDGFNSGLMVEMGRKKFIVDDSILPWWNNRTYQGVYWPGTVTGGDFGQDYVTVIGFFADYDIFLSNSFAYRYYKKLDFILGMIGGAVFLLFLIFWLPFSYINRTLQKMKNAQQLLLIKDDIITTEQNLHKINIPFYYIFTRYLPGNAENKIIQQAENQIDIVRLIKKIKVTHRNLRTKGVDLSFKSKDIDLESKQPQQFAPDRPVIENLQITWDAYQTLTNSQNTNKIYQNNPVVLSLLPNSNQKIDQLMHDQVYQKNRSHNTKYANCKSRISHYVGQIIRFFDIFGARPMFNAQPQSSSCWGFLLTVIIIVLSILTFALTIKNMDSVQIITSHRYEKPQDHNFQLTTGQNFRFAFCFDSNAANRYLTGSNKSVSLTFYKQSKRNGYQQIPYERMISGQFESYFQLKYDDPYVTIPSQNCFRPSNNQKIPMGGSYQTINQAYFGARLDPYCSGTVAQCQNRKNQTLANFVSFVNYRTYAIFLSQNKYSPTEGRIISGIAGDSISESDNILNASLLRTQTRFLSSIQLIDDRSTSFARTPPKTLQRTVSFSEFGDRNQQRKGDLNSDPGYIFQLRSNGQVKSIILRTYKIDFLLGIIGGVFLFWYFFVHFFAKMYNSFKLRAKLAQILHQEDGYDESILVHFLHLTKFPKFLLCCSQLQKDVERVSVVDQKMQRDLDYLQLTKTIDNCYRLSSALFGNLVQKDLSLIYFRQKIDEADLVKPKRLKQVQKDQFQDDEFLEFDDDYVINQEANVSHNIANDLMPQISAAIDDHDLQKIINMNKSVQTCPLYDQFVPNKKQSLWKRIIKRLDLFKNPPELTLDGQRDVKSIFGGLAFFLVLALIIVVVAHFVTIYTDGTDYTVSYSNIVDADLSNVDPSNMLGDLYPGINLVSGRDFKFLITFNKKDQYFPFDVSQYIGPIGIRMLQYTITKSNGVVNQAYEQIEFQPCNNNYLKGFVGPYNDPTPYQDISLGYCLPDGKSLSLSGTPQDSVRKYFKVSIYNKFGNSTGKAFLNSFFKIYLVEYKMSVPRLDIFSKNFNYDMSSFNFFTDPYSYPVQTNLTFSKVVFTDKYYSKSRQTYNDRTKRSYERLDVDFLSTQNTRNLTFYYNGNVDHYILDYPGGGQLFGIVGGVIALFVFIIYSFITSFNEYRMKYLIGQRLYTFDKKLSGLSKQKMSRQKGKKINMKKLQEATRALNNFSQLDILLAWILNPIGYLRDNYNFNKTLRRVTLLIDKVQNDINLYNVYKQIFTFRDVLDKKVKLAYSGSMESPVTLTSVYIKHIHQKQSIKNHIPIISKQAKKHKLSSYQQFKINKAIQAKVNPQTVLGDKILNRAFGLDDGTSVLESRMRMLEQRNNESLIHASFVNNNTNRRVSRNHNNSTHLQQSNDIFAESQQVSKPQFQSSENNIQAFQIQDASQNL